MASNNNNNQILQYIESLIDGDYCLSIVANNDISKALQRLADKLSLSTQKQMTNIVGISIQANETATFSANMLYNLRKVDEQAQGITKLTENMVNSVNEMSQHGLSINQYANDAQQVTQLGSQSSAKAINGMETIINSVKASIKKLSFLKGFSRRIAKISEDIKNIADQTNLLALNATIEAARAGESGKGFAVVAGEVKTLASQARGFTIDIDELIENLQEESKIIFESMDDCTLSVNSGQKLIGEVSQRMDEISHQIENVMIKTEQISTSLEYQQEASAKVSQRIINITSSSSESVNGIEKIVDAMDRSTALMNQQILSLSELNVPDKVLKLAQSDHVLWKKRLANMIIGREGLKADELADHHTCRLGMWYDSVIESKYKNNILFKQLVEPHEKVHKHGIQAVNYYNDNNVQAALDEIELVELASKDVLRLLRKLEGK